MQVLDVPESMLDQHGAVSEEVAIAMATGACEKYGADYGLSVTGFAGPTGGTQVLPLAQFILAMHLLSEYGQRSSTFAVTVHPIDDGQPLQHWIGCAVNCASIN